MPISTCTSFYQTWCISLFRFMQENSELHMWHRYVYIYTYSFQKSPKLFCHMHMYMFICILYICSTIEVHITTIFVHSYICKNFLNTQRITFTYATLCWLCRVLKFICICIYVMLYKYLCASTPLYTHLYIYIHV